jgi:ETC complex I subunit conserved region
MENGNNFIIGLIYVLGLCIKRHSRGVAQSGSALVLGTKGRRFESCRPDHFTQYSLGGFMLARIYRPAKTAMQSGIGKTKEWLLEFEAESKKSIDPLMGYTATTDMNAQVRLRFESKEEAISYAQKKSIAFQVIEPQDAKRRIAAYSDNFKSGRIAVWTH